MAKLAVQSKINRVAVLTFISDILIVILEHKGFIDMAGAWLVLLQGFSTMLIIYLRTYKTTAKIEGWLRPPSSTELPRKKLDPLAEAIRRDSEDFEHELF